MPTVEEAVLSAAAFCSKLPLSIGVVLVSVGPGAGEMGRIIGGVLALERLCLCLMMWVGEVPVTCCTSPAPFGVACVVCIFGVLPLPCALTACHPVSWHDERFPLVQE